MLVFTVDPSDLDNLSAVSPTSPSDLKSVTAFARFEFEPGKGNGGTKVLMVEWEDDDWSRHTAGGWKVSWQGKSTQLHADDREADNLRRAYFLLGPGQQIPRTVTLSYEPPPDSAATAKKPQKLTMTPLPAIFPPELGEVARQAGKKGVLHTIWAKKRLQVLENEIQQEQEFNLEGIALEMAIAERDWIGSNFGVSTLSQTVGSSRSAGGLPSISSPKTPGGSRLNEKLKGLSLGTSEEDLNRNNEVNTPSNKSHPLSPGTQDVAVSFFGSFDTSSSKPAFQSLESTLSAKTPEQNLRAKSPLEPVIREKSSDSGDDLFAKAISPRTPAVGKSPFSFTEAEIKPYLQKT